VEASNTWALTAAYIFPEINTAQMYICRKYGYQGSFIIEVDNPDEVNTMKKALNKYNEGIETGRGNLFKN